VFAAVLGPSLQRDPDDPATLPQRRAAVVELGPSTRRAGWEHVGWVRRRARIRAGAALIARGEFSIVIAGLGVAGGAVAELGPLAATYVLILAIGGPVAARVADHVAPTVTSSTPVPLR
jgi:CPA2 family monovalent cation:H+ antiporter-2